MNQAELDAKHGGVLGVHETAEAIEATSGERVTDERIDSIITDRKFLSPIPGTLTICVLTLANGFTVTGESACVDPANYDAGIGEAIAFRNAREKIWLLEGYALAERRYQARRTL